MAAPKQSVFTRKYPASTDQSDYDLYGGQGNVNDNQPNDGNYTTPANKAAESLKSLKKAVS